MSVNAHSAQEIFEIAAAIDNKIKKEGKIPYRFITIDNATRLEEFSLPMQHIYTEILLWVLVGE